LNGFVSEFLTILGAFTSKHLGPAYAAFAASGVILGAIYMLHLVGRVIWGPLKFPHEHAEEHSELPVDIDAREIAILVPIAVLVVVIGILPTRLMDPMVGPVEMIQKPLALAPRIQPMRLRGPAVSMNTPNPAGATLVSPSLTVPEARARQVSPLQVR